MAPLGPQDFAGDWQVARRITDHLAGQAGRFDGQALFAAGPDGRLIYDETGLLQLGQAAPLQANRRYIWQFGAGRVAVHFDDGRPFHNFVPGQTADGSPHPCGDDLYLVRYDFDHWPVWSVQWDVQGPRKDYAMHSHYCRPGTAPLRQDGASGK